MGCYQLHIATKKKKQDKTKVMLSTREMKKKKTFGDEIMKKQWWQLGNN
jgi:hypothetical protein